ncbi:hypothetical protein DPMN_067120 [Dreissena polymorpha]|uniref:Uncharacterized protein n=1 Tax=Dreissena polymorpha TaxID=45954 RepID=A0A9D3YXH0_DREPO|nr:hypothetical protein DPMN_067120 [Dreissena polymorpha]
MPSASEVSTERIAIVKTTQQPIDHSLEDARIPRMMFLQDNTERDSIRRKSDKANAFGLFSYDREDDAEDSESFVSDSEERGSAVNSKEDIISTDAIPTAEVNTGGADINGMNAYIEQVNLNDCHTDLTKDQTKYNNVQKSKTSMSKGTAVNNPTENQQERVE